MFDSCPVCRSKLLEVGYPDEFGFQEYRCPNDCEFSPPVSWRIWNAFGYALILLLTVVSLVLLSPFIIASTISSAIRGVRS